jgi:hypothetical protein
MTKAKLLFALAMLVSCALTFAADLDQKNAKALPADGGDPGKVYMQYVKALESADFPGLKKLMTAEEGKTIDLPEFKKMFPMMQSMHAKDIKITSGMSDGKVAILQATGKDQSGKQSKGTLTLLMENKEWKVQDDAWATDLNQ